MCAIPEMMLTLRRRQLGRDAAGYTVWETISESRAVAPDRAALVLCDLWDRHWCRAAEVRLAALLPGMNALASKLRAAGTLIVHAPSNTTNMCMLERPFAIKAMVRWGFNVVLVRDLTDAVYNPAMPPYVSQAEGTNLMIQYIEGFWCPSVTSGELLAALPASPA
jgi:hypothetical protein